MSSLTQSYVLLTVRGSLNLAPGDAARSLHNQTAGSDEGVAAARALGDLSHKVYTPVNGIGAADNELLFLDVWKDAQGIGTFFADAQVQQGAAALFKERSADLWTPAENAFGFELPAPIGQENRYVGIVRGPIENAEKTVRVFKNIMEPVLSDARRLGQLSHQLYIRLPMPGESGQAEAMGIDVWGCAKGMQEHYASLSGYEAAFSGKPQTSLWEQADGAWREW